MPTEEMGEPLKRPQRLDSLTSLRYVAALLVLLYHMSTVFWRHGVLSTSFANGFVGVTFFFLLSGFVLTWSRRPETTRSTFYAHRFARVWPLHAATWIAMLVILGTESHLPHVGPAASNLFLIHDWIPLPKYYISVNNPSWTLSCELVFYLSFPFIITRLTGRTSRWLWNFTVALGASTILLGLAVYGVGQASGHADASVLVAHFFPALRIGQFVLGMALALLIERGWRCPVSVWPSLLFAAIPFVAAAVISGRRGGSLVVMDAVTLPGLWLVIASFASAELGYKRLRAVTNRRAVQLGQWSFGLYLLQYPILDALADLGVHPQMDLPDVVLGVLGITVISAIVFNLFERPVERILRQRLTPGSAPSVTTSVTPVSSGA